MALRRTAAICIFLGLMCAGWVGGRALGSAPSHGRRIWKSIVRMLPETAGDTRADDGPPSDVFETVLEHVQHEFVEGADNPSKLTSGALGRMLASLDDPKTTYLDRALTQARVDSLKGQYRGIGAVLVIVKAKKADVDYRNLIVVDVAPGGPADKAGIRSGDQITQINDRWVVSYSILVEYDRLLKIKDDAARRAEAEKVNKRFEKGLAISKALPLLLEGEGKPLSLGVERAGGAPFTVKLTTGVTDVEPVRWSVTGNVGVLRVAQFNPAVSDQIAAALAKAGDAKLRGIVVDLRGNPGGVRSSAKTGVDGYDSALQLIGELSGGGPVARLERHLGQQEPLTTPPPAHALGVPVVVLVDGGTANLGELAAAGLRAGAHAKVVGSRTFGDDILSYFTRLQDGSAMEITNAHLFTAGGVDLAKGIEPDVAAPSSASADDVMKQAISALGR